MSVSKAHPRGYRVGSGHPGLLDIAAKPRVRISPNFLPSVSTAPPLGKNVPIVVWGSTMVLKVVERYPGVVYVGAGVLVWTAVKMITGEPLIKPWFQATPILAGLAYLAIPLVLWCFGPGS